MNRVIIISATSLNKRERTNGRAVGIVELDLHTKLRGNADDESGVGATLLRVPAAYEFFIALLSIVFEQRPRFTGFRLEWSGKQYR